MACLTQRRAGGTGRTNTFILRNVESGAIDSRFKNSQFHGLDNKSPNSNDNFILLFYDSNKINCQQEID